MSRVFIVNKSAHDFSAAECYGDLIFLSEGLMPRYKTNQMHRVFSHMMRDSAADDWIVPTSLNVMNSIACAVFAHKHGRLNLLLFKDGNYIERTVVL
jgi:hypothetical protein